MIMGRPSKGTSLALKQQGHTHIPHTHRIETLGAFKWISGIVMFYVGDTEHELAIYLFYSIYS